MLIRVASDLHLEFFRHLGMEMLERHFLPPDERDSGAVLVLAGDVTPDIAQLCEFLERVADRFARVLYIPGNHEYYRSDYDDWNHRARDAVEEVLNVEAAIGEVDAIWIGRTRFVAATMWGDGGNTDAQREAIGNYLNDFRLIEFGGGRFSVADMARLHTLQRSQMALYLSEHPSIVVTHHMPSYSLSHPRFGNECTGGFAGKCDEMMHGANAPVLWIHGHTHDTFDRRIGNTRVVCNPAGYHPEWGTRFNTYFAAPKFIEVEPIAGPCTKSDQQIGNP